MLQPYLETNRLVLRSFSLADAKQVAELAGSVMVSRTTRFIPHPYTTEMAIEWISSHSEPSRLRTHLTCAIADKGSDALYGAVSLMHIDDDQAELGYWIGHPFWGRGYCSEAVGALLEYGFDVLGLNRIVAEHLTSNRASGRVMEKNGMKYIGSRQIDWRDESKVHVETYELTRPLESGPDAEKCLR